VKELPENHCVGGSIVSIAGQDMMAKRKISVCVGIKLWLSSLLAVTLPTEMS
jgi:hypothetical protein